MYEEIETSMNGTVDEQEAMQSLLNLVKQSDADTINRVNSYADSAERRRAFSDEAENNSTVNRNDLKNYMVQNKDLNADRHTSPDEMRMAAAIASKANGYGGFGGFIPETEFPVGSQTPSQPQFGIPYAPAPYQAPPQPPVVQNLQMPLPATKAIVDSLASIANNLPPALRGLYEKQNELLKEVKRTNDLFVAFLKTYATRLPRYSAKETEETADVEAAAAPDEKKD